MKPLIYGILNVTPDSFSDGYPSVDAAVRQAEKLVGEGADGLDIGAESTRPGAEEVGPEEEIRRLLPVLRALNGRVRIPVSVDTRHAETAVAAMGEGAAMINDVSALGDPEMAGAVARGGAELVLMHSRGTPSTMDSLCDYPDGLLPTVTRELGARMDAAMAAGVARGRLWFDPGFGFAKTRAQDIDLFRRLGELDTLGFPLFVGLSRKRFIGELIAGPGGVVPPPLERDGASADAAAAAARAGARILRVHNVALTRARLAQP